MYTDAPENRAAPLHQATNTHRLLVLLPHSLRVFLKDFRARTEYIVRGRRKHSTGRCRRRRPRLLLRLPCSGTCSGMCSVNPRSFRQVRHQDAFTLGIIAFLLALPSLCGKTPLYFPCPNLVE